MEDTEFVVLVLLPIAGTAGFFFLRGWPGLYSSVWGLCIFGALLATLVSGGTQPFSGRTLAGVMLEASMPALALTFAARVRSLQQRPLLMWLVLPIVYLLGFVLALSVAVTSGLLEP